MKNLYKKWKPIEQIPNLLYCEGIHDDYEGFRILLRGVEAKSKTLRITFEAKRSYKNTDEGDLLRTFSTINLPDKSALYIVDNSDWVEWFHEETHNVHKSRNIKHFAIYTPDDCIDVLSEFEPKVEWLN